MRLQLFNVKYQIHSSDSGFRRREEPLVPPSDGCCVCDLFSASAQIQLRSSAASAAPSVTQICSAPLKPALPHRKFPSARPEASNCRQTDEQTDCRLLPGQPERGRGSLSGSRGRHLSSGLKVSCSKPPGRTLPAGSINAERLLPED